MENDSGKSSAIEHPSSPSALSEAGGFLHAVALDTLTYLHSTVQGWAEVNSYGIYNPGKPSTGVQAGGRKMGRALAFLQGLLEIGGGSGADAGGVALSIPTLGGSLVITIPGSVLIGHGVTVDATVVVLEGVRPISSAGYSSPGAIEAYFSSSKPPKPASSPTRGSVSPVKSGPPGSPEHKAGAWEEYLQTKALEGKDPWPYSTWSKVYDLNMTRASKAAEIVKAIHERLGWGTIRQTPVDAGGFTRTLDIVDVARKRAIEVKSGYSYLSEDIAWQIARDKALKDAEWDIEWIFDGTASGPLKEALRAAGIPFSGG